MRKNFPLVSTALVLTSLILSACSTVSTTPYRFISPPIDAVQTSRDNQVALWLVVICCVFLVVGLYYAIRDWRRTGLPIAVLLILGGAVTNLAEPFVNIAGDCWYPRVGNFFFQSTLFEIMSRNMPFWLIFPYIGYFGVLMMCLYFAFRRGASTRTMWLWFIVPVLADIVLEECLMGLSDHLYIYYGNQPLRLHVFPLWWTVPNTMGIYLSAVVMTVFTPLLKKWRVVFALFSTLLCYLAATGLVSVPSIYVINSDYPAWGTQLGGILTFLIAALAVHGCTRLIAADSPNNILVHFQKPVPQEPAANTPAILGQGLQN